MYRGDFEAVWHGSVSDRRRYRQAHYWTAFTRYTYGCLLNPSSILSLVQEPPILLELGWTSAGSYLRQFNNDLATGGPHR